jgi:hypothetical protein
MIENAAKVAAVSLAGLALIYFIGYANGQDSIKVNLSEKTCVNDEYVIIDKPDCTLIGYNMEAGWMDASIPGFTEFAQIKVCGLGSCKGDVQGEYGCIERNKLRKQSR